MPTENPDWIQRILDGSNVNEIDELVESERNLVTEYGKAQSFAGDYLKRGEDIPEALVSAIQYLGGERSGFTGLTVHEAYVYSLRHPKNN
jgi:hypothetical protein